MKYFYVLRPHQWYKNLLVFLAVLFSGNLFNFSALTGAALAFVSFCAFSSAVYVLNDFADRKTDRLHPEKKHRPIAAGRIGILGVLFLTVFLLAVGIGTSLLLPVNVLYAALAYFFLSQLYTLWLKFEPFADVLAVAVNFVIRAVAGAFAIGVWVSPWLVGGVFFFALFLVLGKRRSELFLLKKKAHAQRSALRAYSPELVSNLSVVATSLLVISYSLFVFFGEHQGLFLTLPVVLYAVFYYEGLACKGNIVARKPHLVFKNPRIVVSMLLWLAITLVVLY